MQEQTIQIKGAMTRGLYPTPESVRGGFAQELQFARVTEFGLRAPASFSTYAAIEQWPLPQLIRGRGVTLLAYEDRLYEVDESDMTISTLLASESFSCSSVWHFVDMKNVWLLINDGVVVYKRNKYGMIEETDSETVATSIDINTGCAFKGRMILGGFDPDNYWSASWRAIWQELMLSMPFELTDDMEVGSNCVAWSTIGGGDIFDLFDAEYAINGGLAEDTSRTALDSLFMERWRRNELGVRPMPFQGIVQRVLPLGNRLMVYGADGVVRMRAVAEPTPTFAQEKLLDEGTPYRGAVGGSQAQHICIMNDGELFAFGEESVQRLGYREQLAELLDYEIAISYNQRDDEFVISGKDTDGDSLSFCLTKSGLSKIPNHVTSMVKIGSSLRAVADLDASTEVLYTSDVLDFGYRDLKTLNGAELACSLGTGAIAYLAFDYRNDVTADWSRTAWARFNALGYAYNRVSGVEFRVCVKVTTYTNLKIDSIAVKMQTTSKRIVRGTYAATTGRGTSGESLE